MKNILFITFWDFTNESSSGICKKINEQRSAMESYGYNVALTYIKNLTPYINIDGKDIKIGKQTSNMLKVYMAKCIRKWLETGNNEFYACYIRYGWADGQFYKLVKFLKDNNIKTVMEIPTYPYDGELINGIKDKIVLNLDRKYRLKLYKYIDRIVTYSDDDKIFGIDTIRTTNGIDYESVKLSKGVCADDTIDLIAVAGLAYWHGYDRLITSIGEYYKNGGKRSILFHIVGDGSETQKYKQIAEKYDISDKIIFYGFKSGEELDKIYDKCDIGVDSLGLYRKNVEFVSSLKAKEYGARGLPVITTYPIDVYDKDFEYQLIMENSDADIEIKKIIEFYDYIKEKYENGINIQDVIRNAGIKKASMKATFENIIKYIEN